MNRVEMAVVKERIRRIAQNTDTLIVRLDNLTNRIDTAKMNENSELVEYYERQFADVSLEFMEGVETMIDDWYSLRGVSRPPAEEEVLSPELLDEIHSTMVDVVRNAGDGISTERKASDITARIDTEAPSGASKIVPAEVRRKHRNRVDLTG